MFKPVHVSIVALLTLLTVSFACQQGDGAGDSISPVASAKPSGKSAKSGSPYELVVAYTTNNDGEIDPCG